MKIGIGSTNKSKIAACQKAFNDLGKQFSLAKNKFEFYPTETVTSVPEMPLTKDDIMKGALERALFIYEQCRDKKNTLDFAIGMEGGVYRDGINAAHPERAFLQSWVYCYNGQTGYFGSSPVLTLPEPISSALFHGRRELAGVIDQFSGQNDVRSNEGAFGVLTRDLLTRSASFYFGIISAMVPFLNTRYYSDFLLPEELKTTI